MEWKKLVPLDVQKFLNENPEIKRNHKYTNKNFQKSEPTPKPNVNKSRHAYSSARKWIDKAAIAVAGEKGSNHTFGVAIKLVKDFALSQHEALSIMKEWNVSNLPPWTDEDLIRIIDRADNRPDHKPRGSAIPPTRSYFDTFVDIIINEPEKVIHANIVDDTASLATKFYEDNLIDGKLCKYRWWNDCFYVWNSSYYDPIHIKTINADIFAFIEKIFMEQYVRDKAECSPENCDMVKKKKVTNNIIENVKTGIINLVSVKSVETKEPFWLKPHPEGWNPEDIIPASNRLVHLPSFVEGLKKTFEPKNPYLFSTYSLKYEFEFDSYDGDFEAPPVWSEFLNSIFPDDQESIDCLQEFCGYFLTPSTHLQKILMFIGQKRSGKGTIVRVLKNMLGERNVCFPTFKSLTTQFGKQPLIRKTLAVFPDARLTGRTDVGDVVECLLSISGEDSQTIDRKNISQVDMKLNTRFLISSNELPRLTEHSSALVSRVILIKFNETFIDREDTTLDKRLYEEIPHILRWSIDGWRRLMDRGRFLQPASGQEAIDDFLHLSSPSQHFASDCFDINPEYRVNTFEAFTRYMEWCKRQNRENVGDLSSFIRSIKSAMPVLKFVDSNKIIIGTKLKPGAESFEVNMDAWASDRNKKEYNIF